MKILTHIGKTAVKFFFWAKLNVFFWVENIDLKWSFITRAKTFREK